MKIAHVEPFNMTFPAEPCFRSRAVPTVQPISPVERLQIPDVLEGRSVNLVSLTQLDPEVALRWMMDEEVTNAFISYPPPKTLAEEKRWLKVMIENNGLTEIGFMIQTKESRPIGTAHLNSLDRIDKKAKLGVLIGEKDVWGKGYGVDAASTLLEYAFNILDLNKVYSYSLAIAEEGISLAQQCGLKKEAVLRKETPINGKYVDVVVLSLLNEEYHSTPRNQEDT